MVGAGVARVGSALAGVSLGGGADESVLAEGVAGAAASVPVFAQPARVKRPNKITKLINLKDEDFMAHGTTWGCKRSCIAILRFITTSTALGGMH